MSKRCDICGKGTQFGNTVSKSMNHARRTWKPNIAKVKVQDTDGAVLTVRMCTHCMKSVFENYGITKKVRLNKAIIAQANK